MTETTKETNLTFREQLLKDWNSVKGDGVGWNNPRRTIQNNLEEIRKRVLTDYENYWSYGDELSKEDKKKEDNEKMNTYHSVFEWEEDYKVCYAFDLTPNDYYYQTVECKDYDDFREQITGEKTPDEVEEGNMGYSDLDYDGGFEVGDEQERNLELDIKNLRLKEPTSKRYKITLELEQISELFDNKGELVEIDADYHARRLTQLIHEHLPHLLVRSSNTIHFWDEKNTK